MNRESTESNTAEISSRMMTEDMEAALEVWSSSVSTRRAVSVDRPVLNPDWCGSRSLFWWRYAES